MAQRGHQVSLLTLDPQSAEAFYNIEPVVDWYKLGLGNPKLKASLGMRLKRMMKIRTIMKDFKPDVVLAFQNGFFCLCSVIRWGCVFVWSLRSGKA